MTTECLIVLPALLFSTGAVGILIRRSPLVILLCLELMLNAGNLALVAFSRMVGNAEGQVFALLGSIAIALGYRALPQKLAGAIGTLSIGLAFVCGIAATVSLLGDEPHA